VQVTSDYEAESDPSIHISGEEMGLTPHREVQQVLETPTVAAAVTSSSFEEP
jgi:hypothetical protein